MNRLDQQEPITEAEAPSTHEMPERGYDARRGFPQTPTGRPLHPLLALAGKNGLPEKPEAMADLLRKISSSQG